MCTLAVTNISIDQDLRPGQQKGHHAWEYKFSKPVRTSEAVDLGGEPEATHALNQHNPKLHYKHVLYTNR